MKADVNNTIRPLEDKKHKLKEAMCAKQPDSENELSILSKEVAKLPKLATIRAYIERIKEITKNSRKQDIHIERILKKTRELSNMIQERLHRTYVVVLSNLALLLSYKDTGHQTGNSTFHALMLARFADAWQAKKLVASSRKPHIDKRGSRAVQVGSRAVHNGLLDAGVSPHRKV
ncbi:coiled-coil domain-containing protein 22 isoform X2 [Tanacetum coccineum]